MILKYQHQGTLASIHCTCYRYSDLCYLYLIAVLKVMVGCANLGTETNYTCTLPILLCFIMSNITCNNKISRFLSGSLLEL